MQLSVRLNKVAGYVTEGYTLADIGTDHGYVPIMLVKEKRIPFAIAMDINKGPLERANEHIKEYGLEGKIETRLSNGLDKLKKGEADSVLIAGMGGALIKKILQAGAEVLEDVKELVLSPHTEPFLVREYLIQNGYEIISEDMVYDMGKYYPIIKAVHTDDKNILEAYNGNRYNYVYGKLLLEGVENGCPNQIFLDYLQYDINKLELIVENLKKSNAAKEKIKETNEKIAYIRSVLEKA